MTRLLLTAPLSAALALAACNPSEISRERQPAAPARTEVLSPTGTPDTAAFASPTPTLIPPVGRADGINDGYPDIAPPPLTPEAAKGEKGARNLLLSWARAIELREFDQAWDLFGETANQRWSKAEFARIFAGLEDVSVAVPEGEIEGAAGSLYYTSQATITAEDADGRPVRIEGPVVLRRVNDVPGATAEQLRWHVESAELDWTH